MENFKTWNDTRDAEHQRYGTRRLGCGTFAVTSCISCGYGTGGGSVMDPDPHSFGCPRYGSGSVLGCGSGSILGMRIGGTARIRIGLAT